MINISDRTPKSDRNYDAPDTTQRVDSTEIDLKRFQRWNPEISRVRALERRHFLERFQPEKSEKFVWYLNNNDSLEYERYVYSDSIVTKSAFYNWLDRTGMSYFGADEAIQNEAFAILYTDTVLLRLSGSLDFKFWENLFEEQDWMDEGDYWIKQRKYGRAKWFVLKEDKLKELTDR